MTKPLINISGLYKIFGPNPASVLPMVKQGLSKDEILQKTGHTVGLKDINLEIRKGEIFVIMGLSGSGKSTLIRHFNRLIDPSEGKIDVEGTDIMQLARLSFWNSAATRCLWYFNTLVYCHTARYLITLPMG